MNTRETSSELPPLEKFLHCATESEPVFIRRTVETMTSEDGDQFSELSPDLLSTVRKLGALDSHFHSEKSFRFSIVRHGSEF